MIAMWVIIAGFAIGVLAIILAAILFVIISTKDLFDDDNDQLGLN